MGTGAPILLILITGCWLYMLRTISFWIGTTAILGRETVKMMLQLNTGIAAAVMWPLFGGLLLLINVKGVLPAKIGFASWFLLPSADA